MTNQEPLSQAQSRSDRLEKQIFDYVDGGTGLVWQRQAIFLAATVLTSFYFEAWISWGCFALVQMTEFFDLYLTKRILSSPKGDMRETRRNLKFIVLSTIFSACSISLFVIAIAWQEGATTHFTPLFILFAAALFAAINNHQILPVLLLRLSIYSTAFLFIPLNDIIRTSAPLESPLWLQFFTIIFVLYFVVDCSMIFLKLYRRNLDQLEDLKREHRLAKQALVAKTEFLSTISHELRTPLTSLKGSLTLACQGHLGDLPPKIASALKIAETNCNKLADLITDILDLQNVEAGEMRFEMEPVSLADLIQESVSKNYELARIEGVKLAIQKGSYDQIIYSDRANIHRVLNLVIVNAIKFSGRGKEVSVFQSNKPETAVIHVKDNGIGIAEENRDAVFSAFTQVDSSDRRAVGGTGLGLAIGRKIIEALGGRIDFESAVGEGTIFSLEFDLKELKQN